MDSEVDGRIIEDELEVQTKMNILYCQFDDWHKRLEDIRKSREGLPDKLPDHEEPPEPAFINWLCERFKTRDYEEIKRRIDRIGKMETENPFEKLSRYPNYLRESWNNCAHTIKEIMEGTE